MKYLTSTRFGRTRSTSDKNQPSILSRADGTLSWVGAMLVGSDKLTCDTLSFKKGCESEKRFVVEN